MARDANSPVFEVRGAAAIPATAKPSDKSGDAMATLVTLAILGPDGFAVPLTSIAGQAAPPHLVDCSGAITAGGGAQPFRPADPLSTYLRLANPPTATESLWFCDAVDGTGTAIPAGIDDGFSHELRAGELFTWPTGVATAVSIIAATTGHKFIGRKA